MNSKGSNIILNKLKDGLLIINNQQLFQFANASAGILLRTDPTELLNSIFEYSVLKKGSSELRIKTQQEQAKIFEPYFEEFIHPDFVMQYRRSFTELKKRGFIKDLYLKLRLNNGSYIDTELQGTVACNAKGVIE